MGRKALDGDRAHRKLPVGVRHEESRTTREQPRELLLRGAGSGLSDTELLASILRTGRPGESVGQLAERLLTRFAGVRGVLDAPAGRLAGVTGMGPAKIAALKATRHLFERYEFAVIAQRRDLSCSAAVRRFLSLRLGAHEREVFGVLLLDTRYRLLHVEDLFLGSVDRAVVYPREVLKACLRSNAAAAIVFHNHPSGIAEPSASDVKLTERLRGILLEIDVRLVDHVIVGGGTQVSLAERGLL